MTTDPTLRKLIEDVVTAWRREGWSRLADACNTLAEHLDAHPEPAQPDAITDERIEELLERGRRDRNARRPAQPDAAAGAQDCGPPYFDLRVTRLLAERDAAQAEARHHADRCAALVAEVEGLRADVALLWSQFKEQVGYVGAADMVRMATPAAPVRSDTKLDPAGDEAAPMVRAESLAFQHAPARGGQEAGTISAPSRDADAERADVVAWLRRYDGNGQYLADQIVRGDHVGAVRRAREGRAR